MARLIDADNLRQIIHNKAFDHAKNEATYNALRWVLNQIDNQPTAYDVEKVVEQLDNEAYTTTDTVCGGIFEAVRLNSAIEIVKRGGVE